MQKTDIPNLDALTWPELDPPEWPDFSALELELESLSMYTSHWPDLDWPDLDWTRLVVRSLAATRGPGWCCIPLSDIGGS